MKTVIPFFWATVRCCLLVVMMLYSSSQTHAQPDTKSYKIRNGRMVIDLVRKIQPASLDSFVSQYDLYDLDLSRSLPTRKVDSLQRLGWLIERNDAERLRISKPLTGPDDITDPVSKILFTEKRPSFAAMFPAVSSGVMYGVNNFRNKAVPWETETTLTFILRGHANAKEVMIAGSFTNWAPEIILKQTDTGWTAAVPLKPGKYWYKFVIDGNWITDPANQNVENDGLGNVNSVVFKNNVRFQLKGFTSAKRVYISGSFNNWATRDLLMIPSAEGWSLPVYLAEGTHRYRFIVDGRWMTDPGNPNQLPNEFGESNSVLRLGKPHLFQLSGFHDAKKVFLFGSFNGWRKDELQMIKTGSGWELPYTIGAGNYEYNFMVDGKQVIQRSQNSKENLFLIIDSNYTFHLKDFPSAKQVFLAGDFNGWSPNAFPLQRVGNEWVTSVHLSPGKHLYKFVVDGKWIIDPSNKLWEQNEHDTGNSVIWIEAGP